MDLIILIGAGAVGKMTVGQELMKITDFRLFHNHMMIEPVLEIFGRFDGEVVSKLREDIFDAFMKTKYQGMIFTFMWGFDMQSDWEYIKGVSEKFEAKAEPFTMSNSWRIRQSDLRETRPRTDLRIKLQREILSFPKRG